MADTETPDAPASETPAEKPADQADGAATTEEPKGGEGG